MRARDSSKAFETPGALTLVGGNAAGHKSNRLELSSGASSVEMAGQKPLPGLAPSVSLR